MQDAKHVSRAFSSFSPSDKSNDKDFARHAMVRIDPPASAVEHSIAAFATHPQVDMVVINSHTFVQLRVLVEILAFPPATADGPAFPELFRFVLVTQVEVFVHCVAPLLFGLKRHIRLRLRVRE
jgi:hypothetical protein